MSAAVSTKIAVQAGLLLLSARVDLHPVKAVFDPSLPVTTLSAGLAGRLSADGDADLRSVRGRHVIGLDHHVVPLRSVRVAAPGRAAPVTIGSDLLADNPLDLDLAHGRIRLLEPRDAPRATRGMTAVPAHVTPAGCLEMAGTLEDGRAVSVAFGGTGGEPVPVRIGDRSLLAMRPAPGTCSPGAVSLGWAALAGSRIVIDRPRDTVWMAAAR